MMVKTEVIRKRLNKLSIASCKTAFKILKNSNNSSPLFCKECS